MNDRNKGVIVVMAFLAVIGAMLSFCIAESETLRGWVAVAWAVLPPVWFWYEYTYLTSETEKNDKDFRDRLKFAQDCASKIWLAVGGVFTASYFEALRM